MSHPRQCQLGVQGKEKIEYWNLRRKFVRNIDQYGRDNGIGPEIKLLRLIAQGSQPWAAWSFVQISTQDRMARDLGVSTRTLKRHLRSLRDSGMLVGHLSLISGGPKYIDPETAYPTFTIHPLVVRECTVWFEENLWIQGNLSDRLALNECHFGTYLPTSESDPESENPSKHMVSAASDSVVFRSTYISSSSNTDQRSHVWRLRRSQTRSQTTMNRWRPDEDDDIPVIGRDPDEPKKDGSRKSPVSDVANHFERAWQNARSRHALSGFFPMQPYNPGKKAAFMGWLKKTAIPAFDNDLEYMKQVIDYFCEHAFDDKDLFKPNLPYPVWSQFWRSTNFVREQLSLQGIYSSAERDRRDRDRQDAEARIEQEQALLEQQREAVERRERATAFVPAEEMDWMLD